MYGVVVWLDGESKQIVASSVIALERAGEAWFFPGHPEPSLPGPGWYKVVRKEWMAQCRLLCPTIENENEAVFYMAESEEGAANFRFGVGVGAQSQRAVDEE